MRVVIAAAASLIGLGGVVLHDAYSCALAAYLMTAACLMTLEDIRERILASGGKEVPDARS